MIQQAFETTQTKPAPTPNVPPQGNKQYDSLARQARQALNGKVIAAPVVGVTSCQAGAGATTVAVNLAISTAQASSDSVLLIETEAGSPILAETFNLHFGPGLFQGLEEQLSLEDCIQETEYGNLSVMVAGSDTSEFGRGVDMNRFFRMIGRLKQQYSQIIIDLPLANDSTSCFDLVGGMDGVLLVVEAEKTCGELAKQTKGLLEKADANLLGVVVNKDQQRAHSNEVRTTGQSSEKQTLVSNWLRRLFF